MLSVLAVIGIVVILITILKGRGEDKINKNLDDNDVYQSKVRENAERLFQENLANCTNEINKSSSDSETIKFYKEAKNKLRKIRDDFSDPSSKVWDVKFTIHDKFQLRNQLINTFAKAYLEWD